MICVLLLRGPQTPGELRTRTDRLYPFDDLNAVHSALNLLMNRQPPLVKLLPRQPGTKEARYAHLLSGDVEESLSSSAISSSLSHRTHTLSPADATTHTDAADLDRIVRLEEEVAALRSELAELKSQLVAFQKQFQ